MYHDYSCKDSVTGTSRQWVSIRFDGRKLDRVLAIPMCCTALRDSAWDLWVILQNYQHWQSAQTPSSGGKNRSRSGSGKFLNRPVAKRKVNELREQFIDLPSLPSFLRTDAARAHCLPWFIFETHLSEHMTLRSHLFAVVFLNYEAFYFIRVFIWDGTRSWPSVRPDSLYINENCHGHSGFISLALLLRFLHHLDSDPFRWSLVASLKL